MNGYRNLRDRLTAARRGGFVVAAVLLLAVAISSLTPPRPDRSAFDLACDREVPVASLAPADPWPDLASLPSEPDEEDAATPTAARKPVLDPRAGRTAPRGAVRWAPFPHYDSQGPPVFTA